MQASIRYVEEMDREWKNLFSVSVLDTKQNFILIVSPRKRSGPQGAILLEWILKNPKFISEGLIGWGGILFRDFQLNQHEFKLLANLTGNGVSGTNYAGGVVPRVQIDDTVFLATISPKTNTLLQHHEMAYMPTSPSKIMFLCETPATSGGATPICSTRQFMKRLDTKILQNLKTRKIQYRRYLTKEDLISGYIIGWKRAYETDDKKQVEHFLSENHMSFQWGPNDTLTVTHEGSVVKTHPVTGEELWHNQIYPWHRNYGKKGELTPAFFRSHGPGWNQDVREFFMKLHPQEFPMNCYYGNGDFIGLPVIDHVDKIFAEETRSFQWSAGDCLVLDNLLASHGREPYEGDQRRVLTTWKYGY